MPLTASAFTVPSLLKYDVALLSNLKTSVEDKPNQNVESFFFPTSNLFIAHFTVLENSVKSHCGGWGLYFLSPVLLHLTGVLKSVLVGVPKGNAHSATHTASGTCIQKEGSREDGFHL